MSRIYIFWNEILRDYQIGLFKNITEIISAKEIDENLVNINKQDKKYLEDLESQVNERKERLDELKKPSVYDAILKK